MSAISVSHLTKTFNFPVKDNSQGWFKNLIRPELKSISAVDDITFTVESGERIAFIGPNGAGKSTTIKMLTGILFPSSGNISVLGLDPSIERKKLAYRIGTVFGQRSQLFPNLPLTDSLEFFGAMYDLEKTVIQTRILELTNLFELGDFINQPVRKLSLGQRMRAEVAASLIHKPEIVFLDEPTIGLDVVAKKSLRDLLRRLNEEEGTTIFLTSHDVGDIESLCERTIIVNHGQIMHDMKTAEITKDFIHEKYIDLIPHTSFSDMVTLPNGMNYRAYSSDKITIAIDLKMHSLTEALSELLRRFDVSDVDVYDIELEDVIRQTYEADSPRH